MSQRHKDGTLTRVASTDIDKDRLCRFTSTGQWVLCGANEIPEGVSTEFAKSGADLTCELVGANGTQIVTGSAAIALTNGRATLFCAANGKVAGTGTAGKEIGVAYEAASADGHKIEARLRLLPV